MNNEEKIQLYSCIKRQFKDTGLYKKSRVYDWLFTNGFSLEKLGYNTFDELCGDLPEIFTFQDDANSEFILINKWQTGENNLSDVCFNGHPADSFFGTRNIILNDDIIEMTQQSLYALTKIIGNGLTVQQMKQDVYKKFEDAKQTKKLDFFGEKYVFPIDYCHDGLLVNGIVTKNLNSFGKSLYFSFEKTRIFKVQSSLSEKKMFPPEIPEEDKTHIYRLLTRNYHLNEQIHMASVSKFLTDHGVDRMKFGFYKMKDFLSQLPFLELKEIILGGVPQILVTIRELNSEKKFVYSTINQHDIADNSSVQTAQNSISSANSSSLRIPAGKLTDFCNLPAKPMAILEKYIIENGGNNISELTEELSEDFDAARRNGTVHVNGGKIIFPCRYCKTDGSNIELTLKLSTYEGKEWFLYYVDTIERDNKNGSISPIKQLESFAYLGNRQVFLYGLAALAADEEWDFRTYGFKNYQILNQYLKFTFSRLMRENKVCISQKNQFAAFNTGLVDKNYDDIFACFVPNENNVPEWKLAGFCTANSNLLGKQLVENLTELPQPPVYFEKAEDLFFDSTKALHIDYERLIIDNIYRFPLSFLKSVCGDCCEITELLDKISSAEKYEKNRIYNFIKDYLLKNQRLLSEIEGQLKIAVETAKKRAKTNYKTAIPSYFPKRDAAAFVLPLSLRDEKKPEIALAVELRSTGYYAQSVLTLQQAYIDARLVCRLSDGWLTAEQIPDNIQDEHNSTHCEEIT